MIKPSIADDPAYWIFHGILSYVFCSCELNSGSQEHGSFAGSVLGVALRQERALRTEKMKRGEVDVQPIKKD